MRELWRRIHYLLNRRRFDDEGAAGLAQLLRRELYGLSTIDPIAYISAIVLFLFAVGLAALWPARRALRVDPLVALRCD